MAPQPRVALYVYLPCLSLIVGIAKRACTPRLQSPDSCQDNNDESRIWTPSKLVGHSGRCARKQIPPDITLLNSAIYLGRVSDRSAMRGVVSAFDSREVSGLASLTDRHSTSLGRQRQGIQRLSLPLSDIAGDPRPELDSSGLQVCDCCILLLAICFGMLSCREDVDDRLMTPISLSEV